jgi:peptidoglycan/xylan/chitin deacetylase (PgdA/CDA1 family)
VALTFDDGFRDFMTHAVPLLESAHYSSTLFVPTGFVGSTSRWLVAEGEQRRDLVSWAELASLRDLEVECGAHSHSHPQLDLLSRRVAAREISLSKALLEDHLQTEVRSFAYPFGYSKPAVRALVASLGFGSAVGVGDLTSAPDDDLFAIPRLTVTCDTTVPALEALLTAPRTRVTEATTRARSLASRALRQARLKKRDNAPRRSPGVPTSP